MLFTHFVDDFNFWKLHKDGIWDFFCFNEQFMDLWRGKSVFLQNKTLITREKRSWLVRISVSISRITEYLVLLPFLPEQLL